MECYLLQEGSSNNCDEHLAIHTSLLIQTSIKFLSSLIHIRVRISHNRQLGVGALCDSILFGVCIRLSIIDSGNCMRTLTEHIF